MSEIKRYIQPLNNAFGIDRKDLTEDEEKILTMRAQLICDIPADKSKDKGNCPNCGIGPFPFNRYYDEVRDVEVCENAITILLELKFRIRL